LSFCPFSFGYCVVCSSSIYGFWLPLLSLQTRLTWVMELPSRNLLFYSACGIDLDLLTFQHQCHRYNPVIIPY
jgi:hypothetical protein